MLYKIPAVRHATPAALPAVLLVHTSAQPRGRVSVCVPARACFARPLLTRVCCRSPWQGPRVAASAGLALGAFGAGFSLMTRQMASKGMLKNFL